MMTKPPKVATPAPVVVPATPAPAVVVPAPLETPAPTATTSVAPDAPGPAAAAAQPAGDAPLNSSFLSGPALETAVTEICSMGFPKEQVMRAMKASFNNADRAVEYLMNVRPIRTRPTSSWADMSRPQGMPESSAPLAAIPATPSTPSPSTGAGASFGTPAVAATPTPATNAPRNLFEAAAAAARAPAPAAAPTAASAASSAALASLRSQPIFGQLRTLVQQNPALLQPFLQQLSTSNPELLQVRPVLLFRGS